MKLNPDAFPGDPYGHATNQAGHAAIVGMTAALILWPWWGIAAPVVVAVAYGLVWEVGVQRLPDWRDGLEDTVHVGAGASIIALALSDGYWPTVAAQIAWLALLAVGVRRRR